MLQELLQYIPKHRKYIELCGGGVSLLVAKYPAEIEVYNDVNERLFNLYTVLRDKKLFEKFSELCNSTTFDNSEIENAKLNINKTTDVDQAYYFWILSRMCLRTEFINRYKNIPTCKDYLESVEKLNEIHERLRIVQIECSDYVNVLDRYDSEDALFYVDFYEIDKDNRDIIIDKILECEGKFLVHCYKECNKLEASGFKKIELKHDGFLLMNYETQKELF